LSESYSTRGEIAVATAIAIEEPVPVPPVSPAPASRVEISAVSTAELAECCCPDFCERDHDND